MKKAIILCLAIVVIPIFGFAQSIENLDYISPFHDGLAAIEKNGEWAFINKKGDIVINFRNDLVITKNDKDSYPIFYNERCLIQNKQDGISYFGYINTSGKTILEPQFLNASNFGNNNAIVLKLVKEKAGKNEVLGKNVVYYKYHEVIIDTNGKILNYITQDGINVVLDKKFLKKPPKITSKRISNDFIVIKDKNGKWTIEKLN